MTLNIIASHYFVLLQVDLISHNSLLSLQFSGIIIIVIIINNKKKKEKKTLVKYLIVLHYGTYFLRYAAIFELHVVVLK